MKGLRPLTKPNGEAFRWLVRHLIFSLTNGKPIGSARRCGWLYSARLAHDHTNRRFQFCGDGRSFHGHGVRFWDCRIAYCLCGRDLKGQQIDRESLYRQKRHARQPPNPGNPFGSCPRDSKALQ
jgi:hypothetical protein